MYQKKKNKVMDFLCSKSAYFRRYRPMWPMRYQYMYVYAHHPKFVFWFFNAILNELMHMPLPPTTLRNMCVGSSSSSSFFIIDLGWLADAFAALPPSNHFVRLWQQLQLLVKRSKCNICATMHSVAPQRSSFQQTRTKSYVCVFSCSVSHPSFCFGEITNKQQ